MTNTPLLDLNDVLERLGGDKTLCASLFLEFVSRYKGISDEIVSHLENKSWLCAANSAHRLKGVALNIGAKKLAECASSLEETLKTAQQSDLPIETIDLNSLNTLIPKTFAELESQSHLLLQESHAEISNPLSGDEIQLLLSEAKASFDTDYGKALRIVEQLAPQCPKHQYQEVHDLLGLMKLFNITSARQVLHTIA